jgi:hypothetical protein
MTEKQIAQQLEVDQSTISEAIKAPKDLSQQFVYDFKIRFSLLLQAMH